METAVKEHEIKGRHNRMVALCVLLAFVPCAIAAIYIYADVEISGWHAFVNPIDVTALLWLGVTYVHFRRTRTKRAAWLFALFPIAFVEPVLLASLWFSSAYPHQEIPRHAEALIICPGAKQTRWVKFEGTDQLSYQVEVEYPASSTVSCISGRLKEKGWRALEEDYWNPGLPSSHVRGWTNFVDATVHPEATVDQWAAEWENEAGDIVWYSLRYVYPPGDRHTLAINAGFVPANIAKKMTKTPTPESRRLPAARTTVQTVEPSQGNSTQAVDNCGLTAYPVSRSTEEILAAIPHRSERHPNSTMLAKVAVDPEGRVTHLRVLRLAYPEAPNADAINEQAVDSIRRWRFAPTTVAGKPMAVCSDVVVTIDLGKD